MTFSHSHSSEYEFKKPDLATLKQMTCTITAVLLLQQICSFVDSLAKTSCALLSVTDGHALMHNQKLLVWQHTVLFHYSHTEAIGLEQLCEHQLVDANQGSSLQL